MASKRDGKSPLEVQLVRQLVKVDRLELTLTPTFLASSGKIGQALDGVVFPALVSRVNSSLYRPYRRG